MSRKVELVRLQGDGEALPGPPPRSRTADEVFKKDKKGMKRPDEDTIQKALEGKKTKFVSETELKQNKELYGERLEDGTFSGKTLTEAIISQREEKDAKFKDNWKQMKQGKNRPLDDDELHFLQRLADEESAKEKAMREQEQKALERMQTARQAGQAPVQHPRTTDSHMRHKPAAKRHKVVPRVVKSATPLVSSGQDANAQSISLPGDAARDRCAAAASGGDTVAIGDSHAGGPYHAGNTPGPSGTVGASDAPGQTGGVDRGPVGSISTAAPGRRADGTVGALSGELAHVTPQPPANSTAPGAGLLCGYSSSSSSALDEDG